MGLELGVVVEWGGELFVVVFQGLTPLASVGSPLRGLVCERRKGAERGQDDKRVSGAKKDATEHGHQGLTPLARVGSPLRGWIVLAASGDRRTKRGGREVRSEGVSRGGGWTG